MKLFLRIVTTSFSIAFTVALFLSILIIAEMKSWTFLWLYVPLFLVVYEMEKINLKKKKHTSSFKYRKYTSLYDQYKWQGQPIMAILEMFGYCKNIFYRKLALSQTDDYFYASPIHTSEQPSGQFPRITLQFYNTFFYYK